MSAQVLSSRATELIEPSSGEVFATVAECSVSELDRFVELARRGAAEWQRTSIAERSQLLSAIADAIDEDAEALARTESRNVGKPIREARGEVALAARTFRYYAGAIDKHYGQTIPSNGSSFHYTIRRPFGVVGAIVPWNFPLVLAAYKAAPALAAGNAILIKPAGLTPLTAIRLAELAADAGLPEGCLQTLVGAGGTVGRALVDHPAVAKISFTGSTQVGREVVERSARWFKRLTLELGGKSANVIFADTVLERALDSAVEAAFANAGQDCCARSRILVEQPVYEQAVIGLADRIGALSVGDPLDEATEIGPLVSSGQRERVLEHIGRARADGARIVCGGEAPSRAGFYVEPTLITDVSPEMAVMREEIFGPVVAVFPFEDEAEAIAVANGTEYGLSASVWTQDAGRATRVAHMLESGVVSVNSSSSVHVTAPFGGVKASGLGRELGMAALDAYTELKSVYHALEL
jgi:acyl-CoA reductase-like NAD-dependent aldehyde dehydrogenase